MIFPSFFESFFRSLIIRQNPSRKLTKRSRGDIRKLRKINITSIGEGYGMNNSDVSGNSSSEALSDPDRIEEQL